MSANGNARPLAPVPGSDATTEEIKAKLRAWHTRVKTGKQSGTTTSVASISPPIATVAPAAGGTVVRPSRPPLAVTVSPAPVGVRSPSRSNTLAARIANAARPPAVQDNAVRPTLVLHPKTPSLPAPDESTTVTAQTLTPSNALPSFNEKAAFSGPLSLDEILKRKKGVYVVSSGASSSSSVVSDPSAVNVSPPQSAIRESAPKSPKQMLNPLLAAVSPPPQTQGVPPQQAVSLVPAQKQPTLNSGGSVPIAAQPIQAPSTVTIDVDPPVKPAAAASPMPPMNANDDLSPVQTISTASQLKNNLSNISSKIVEDAFRTSVGSGKMKDQEASADWLHAQILGNPVPPPSSIAEATARCNAVHSFITALNEQFSKYEK